MSSKYADERANWQPARLIPTSGIRGIDEQEKRATSALLSVMMSVPSFGRAIVRSVGAPAGRITTYIEPQLAAGDGRKIRPDGLIEIQRGGRRWTALVEVKTGTNTLDAKQIEDYLDAARDRAFDCVLTISNQMVGSSDLLPVTVARQKLRRVQLHHWSWVQILTEAVFEHEHRGISDPDQAYILSELIYYLQHPSSGAMAFEDMGPNWVAVREGGREGTLVPSNAGVADVVARWDQLVQYLGLRLGAELGAPVREVLSRRERNDPMARRQRLIRQVCTTGDLDASLRIPDAAGDIELTASLKSRLVRASIRLSAPDRGYAATRVRWLIRQLADAPDDLRIETAFAGTIASTSKSLREARDDESVLLVDRRSEPRRFTLTFARQMGLRGDAKQNSFIWSVDTLLHDFYREVVQGLRPWRSAPPRLREVANEPAPEMDSIPPIPLTPEEHVDTRAADDGDSNEEFANRDDNEERALAPLAYTPAVIASGSGTTETVGEGES